MTRLLVPLLVAASSLLADVPTAVAIRNARVVPVSGPTIPRGTVVFRNGLIEAVGTDVPVPTDAWVVEGEGLTVYPGLIDALSTIGIPEAAPATTATGGRGGGGQQQTNPAAPAASRNRPARGPHGRR